MTERYIHIRKKDHAVHCSGRKIRTFLQHYSYEANPYYQQKVYIDLSDSNAFFAVKLNHMFLDPECTIPLIIINKYF